MMSFRAERSVVENGAAGEAATWTGRPKAERTGSERIKSREVTLTLAQRDVSTSHKASARQATSLDITRVCWQALR